MSVSDKVQVTVIVALAALVGVNWGWWHVSKKWVRHVEGLVESGRLARTWEEERRLLTWELRHPVHATLLVLWMVFGQGIGPMVLGLYLLMLWGVR